MIRIRTGCRLHFGLIAPVPVPGWDRVYGGIGLMLEKPGFDIQVSLAERNEVTGPDRAAVLPLLERLSVEHQRCFQCEVLQAIPSHVGLGSGTQRALAVHAAVRELLRLLPLTAEEAAMASGRGKRSAIGTYGFYQGGFLYDLGRSEKAPGTIASLEQRVAFPGEWPIILGIPKDAAGPSGEVERKHFTELPTPDLRLVRRLKELVEMVILPSIVGKQIEPFAEGLLEYNQLAGEFFTTVQGGTYSTPRIAQQVQMLRALGVTAVGQSSWGPVVYGVCDSDSQAEEVLGKLKMQELGSEWMIAKAKNQ